MQPSDFDRPEMIEVYCDCPEGQKEPAYVFTDGILEEFSTTCRFCQKTIYNVTCKENSCGSGFSFPSGSKQLDEAAQTWKCEVCGKTNSLDSVKNTFRAYTKAEIPEEIFKKYPTPRKISKVGMFILFLICLGTFYVIKDLIVVILSYLVF